MLRKLISYQSFLKRTCSIRKIAILLSILLFVLSTPVLADIRGTDINGKPVILRSDGTWSYINLGKTCRDYANRAISQQRNNQSRGCGFAGVRWHLDYNKHYNGCMRSGAQWSVRETNLRQNALNTCSKTGGKTKICQAYANNAIAQQRANLNRGCGFAGGLWHLDYKTHHKWCMLVSAQARGKATNDRRDALARCTDPTNQRTFVNPKWNGYIVDNCVTWATTCGGGGAHNFCRLKGFKKASAWKHFNPGTTYVIGSKRVCHGSFCVGYSSITCTR